MSLLTRLSLGYREIEMGFIRLLFSPPPYEGAAYCVALCLSVCPSVCPSVPWLCTLQPSYERTSKIEKLRFSLMGQRHICTFRHAQRAAYRTAISAAQTCYLQLFTKQSQNSQTNCVSVLQQLWINRCTMQNVRRLQCVISTNAVMSFSNLLKIITQKPLSITHAATRTA